MTKEEREAFYDKEIAPALFALARKCEDFDMSMVATVEWYPGETGRTATVRENASIVMQMARMGAEALGNADALILGLKRYGEKHGHNSAYLHMMAGDHKR